MNVLLYAFSHLKGINIVVAVHVVLYPALLIDARIISEELL